MQSKAESQISYKKHWRRWLLAITLIVALGLNGVGMFIGNIIYKETSVLHSHLNTQKLARFNRLLENGKKEKQWEDVSIQARLGYPLHGTYIPIPKPPKRHLSSSMVSPKVAQSACTIQIFI
ncbi:hypothetical protein [Sporomusa carbonis]|uniref:hypothetical protein n=1 Tax=Sporomusa carbonis TaxID=3076075 RepID=UPI003C7D7132